MKVRKGREFKIMREVNEIDRRQTDRITNPHSDRETDRQVDRKREMFVNVGFNGIILLADFTSIPCI